MKNIKNYTDYTSFWKENYEKDDSLLLSKIGMILESYHMYGKLIGYDLLSDNKDYQAGFYYCASLKPIDEDVNPYDDMVLTQTYKGQLFFPYEFAINMEDNEPLTVYSQMCEFIANAYAINQAFKIHNKKTPKVLYYDDVYQIRRDMKFLADSDINQPDKVLVKENIDNIVKKYDDPNYVSMKTKTLEELINNGSSVSFMNVSQSIIDRFEYKLNKERYMMYYIDHIPQEYGDDFHNSNLSVYNPWEKYSTHDNYYKVYYKNMQESTFIKVFNDVTHEYLNTNEIINQNEEVKNYILSSHNYSIKQIPCDFTEQFNNACKKQKLLFAYINSVRLENKLDHCNIIYLNKDEDKFQEVLADLVSSKGIGFELSRFASNYNRVEPKKNNSKFKFWEK